ncbi:MAG TPA: ABC transporter permease [Bacteroidia bacterium]|jgi:phospholipid/cholesterol/gamma-HCH transport system permease protein|nr:ABC transporter permease [Bacteroidia bacterium]
MSGRNTLFSPVKNFLLEAGEIAHFTWKFFREGFKPPYEWGELMRQSFEIGYRSIPLVSFTAFIMGLVITIQSHPALEVFGAESWLPSIVSVSLVREITPVITALICAGKIGSSIGAEIGSMKVTEQIDAMEVSGTNPFKYLVVTRVLSTTLMIPLLVIFGDAVALYGGFLGVNIRGTTSLHLFWEQVFNKLTFGDVFPSIIKSVFFGFVIGIVGSYKGYTTSNGTEGVGRSANAAVVISSFIVFIVDLLAAQLSDILHLT